MTAQNESHDSTHPPSLEYFHAFVNITSFHTFWPLKSDLTEIIFLDKISCLMQHIACLKISHLRTHPDEYWEQNYPW
jgi:hypothetical protein